MTISNKYEAGDPVSHKGQRWEVVYQEGFMVRITNREEKKTVRANQVRRIEAKR